MRKKRQQTYVQTHATGFSRKTCDQRFDFILFCSGHVMSCLVCVCCRHVMFFYLIRIWLCSTRSRFAMALIAVGPTSR